MQVSRVIADERRLGTIGEPVQPSALGWVRLTSR